MNKPDIIVSWPRNCDYPLWRQFIRDERQRFNEIIIAFTETYEGADYRQFVTDSMFPDYIHAFNAPTPGPSQDWRDMAVNAGLLHSYNAEWVWFTEQDFYPLPGFWEEVQMREVEGCNVIGVYQGDRLHPCCIFVRRDILNKTSRKFGVVVDKLDHFGVFQQDLGAIEGAKIGLVRPQTYIHLNGLSHNFRLITQYGTPNYDPEAFYEWLKACLAVKVPLDSGWVEVVKRALDHSPTAK